MQHGPIFWPFPSAPPPRLTTHFQHRKSTHFQHRLTPNTKNSLPTPKINSLPTQKALFGVEGESIFHFPIGTEASLLEPHHKQTLQGKWSTLRKPSRGFNPLGWGGEPSGYHTGGMINTDKPFKGIQPFRLGGGGNHQGIIQGEWSTLRKPSRGFNPLDWGGEPSGYHTGG